MKYYIWENYESFTECKLNHAIPYSSPSVALKDAKKQKIKNYKIVDDNKSVFYTSKSTINKEWSKAV